ncbi:hypothetical protein R3P38DRAFT_3366984 [Favolaschia claudopus]|uniref:Uncharacterized protein n=1 Tax=Favolaschia claudopus TaxID=2862362 RepID=A0AAW0ABZ3_9AGAR
MLVRALSINHLLNPPSMNTCHETPGFSGLSPHLTITGGIGGSGGGGLQGGVGGVGEAPQFHVSSAVGWNVQVNGNLTNYAPAALSAVQFDCRQIPMGDINLQAEIQAVKKFLCTAVSRPSRYSVQKLYSAKLDGKATQYTVAMYQGEGAEERWKKDVSRYTAIRHPTILQLYGIARSGNLSATIFHDEYIYFFDFVEIQHRQSGPMAAVHVWASASYEFKLLIRRSTGQLCAQFSDPEDPESGFLDNTLNHRLITHPENLIISDFGRDMQIKIIGELLGFLRMLDKHA